MSATSLRQKPDDVKQRKIDPVATPIAALDPTVAAQRAQLRYVHASMPGITRHEARNGFDYRLPDGSLLRDIATLKCIRNLAVPPAWTDVWICRGPNGHLQATGCDRRGRKQYRYHPRWREVRDDAKYIFDGCIEGTPLKMLANKTAAYLKKNIDNMSAEEAAVTAFLRLRLAADLTART